MLLAADSLATGSSQEEVIAVLSALAQQTRLELVRLLVNAGSEGLTAGDIATRLRVAPAPLSFHFRQLVSAAMLKHHRRGRLIYYTVDRSRVKNRARLPRNWCGTPEPG